MRCLRQSLWLSPAPPPQMTTVVRDCDTVDSLEAIDLQMIEGTAKEGGLVLSEIFKVPDGTGIVEATEQGMRRVNLEQEAHQTLLYYWTISQWGLLKEGGTLMMDKPAPLTREEIAPVLSQLALHPEYRNFTIISTDETGALVVLDNGKVKDK